ncbi:hypothetical protein C9I98_09805 [Photobacterium sanctipauli]|uniref:Uncharacterized protein n=1 Tax=Photobacterium sanctipauli TaxID=1342794 RepID=A0A2T3NVM3_9GAMM|nr:hypothetical protein [Photobacterium sanctipauli]PSW20334.1 hypothetical protein C9I98_09805 [Photobacterium sanctipauli]
MNKMVMNTMTKEAPSWVLSFLIVLLLTMQLTVKADDVEAQRITTPDGQVVYAWQGDGSELDLDIDQHIPSISDKTQPGKE